jgi:N-methylhydantoinase A
MKDVGELVRLGIDIGGTFTDVTVVGEMSSETVNLKVLTSISDPGQAILQALETTSIGLADVQFLCHGTTVAINMIIERKGARTGIIATQGFRDILELRRGARTHLLDPLMDKPFLFVPRRWRREVPERMAWDGKELQPLDTSALTTVVTDLVEKGVESIALCFLHSYANPVHEREAAASIREHFPDLYCTQSAGLDAEMGEYERTSTAALNAYIHPGVNRYLANLEPQLRTRGLRVPFHIMQSNGGVMTSAEAARRPIRVLESGPAAGAIAVAHLGALLGLRNLISFDMGGTTTKASVIEDSRPVTTVEFELFEEPGHPGSGWPIRVPMIDIIEIGAGGGSIAWLDHHGGELQVGPQSAGAEPGPVCYGRGGTEPTVTDANAATGRLASLLGGGFSLDVDAARLAIGETLARPLGLTIEEAAAGILEINDARAADLLREVTVARGRDPRDYSLVAIGGAGPMAAAYVMRHAGMQQVIVPPSPGNASAFGLLLTDLIHDAVRSHIRLASEADLDQIERIYSAMELGLRDRLRSEGTEDSRIVLERTVDLRYKGQFHVINVTLQRQRFDEEVLTEAVRDFHAAHLGQYLYNMPEEPVELVNLRVRAVGTVRRPSITPAPRSASTESPAGTRSVYFREVGNWLQCSVYKRDRVGADSVLEGPAVIEEDTSTTLIPPGFRGTVDGFGNLIIRSHS